jgi:hypothetical protein
MISLSRRHSDDDDDEDDDSDDDSDDNEDDRDFDVMSLLVGNTDL